MKKLVIFFVFLMNAIAVLGQQNYPKPTVKDYLFYIQHNRGHNTFIYQVNLTSNGDINQDAPVKISRQLFDKNGEVKPITAIQRKFAYGLEATKTANNRFELSLVSYPKQKLYLEKGKNNKFLVRTTVKGKPMTLNHIFITQKEGTAGLNTEVEMITFYGKDNYDNNIEAQINPN